MREVTCSKSRIQTTSNPCRNRPAASQSDGCPSMMQTVSRFRSGLRVSTSELSQPNTEANPWRAWSSSPVRAGVDCEAGPQPLVARLGPRRAGRPWLSRFAKQRFHDFFRGPHMRVRRSTIAGRPLISARTFATGNLVWRPAFGQPRAHRFVDLRPVHLFNAWSLPSTLASPGVRHIGRVTVSRQLPTDRRGIATQGASDGGAARAAEMHLRYPLTLFLGKLTWHCWDSIRPVETSHSRLIESPSDVLLKTNPSNRAFETGRRRRKNGICG